MSSRLVLWDVDGTLVRAGDVGAAVFDLAIEDVLGERPAQRVRMSGKTDPLIVREYMHQMGHGSRPDLDQVMARILEALVARLDSAASREQLAEEGAVCPGVPEVLERLAGDGRVVSTLLTGNLRPNAAVKVSAFGLDRHLDLEVGAYGSDHEDRNCLVPVATARFTERYGVAPAAGDVWVVGDTPRDLACARAAGARCLLVATGRYRFAELDGLSADAALPDLAAAEAVVKLLTGDL